MPAGPAWNCGPKSRAWFEDLKLIHWFTWNTSHLCSVGGHWCRNTERTGKLYMCGTDGQVQTNNPLDMQWHWATGKSFEASVICKHVRFRLIFIHVWNINQLSTHLKEYKRHKATHPLLQVLQTISFKRNWFWKVIVVWKEERVGKQVEWHRLHSGALPGSALGSGKLVRCCGLRRLFHVVMFFKIGKRYLGKAWWGCSKQTQKWRQTNK